MNRPRGPLYRPTPLWRDAQRFLVEGAVRQFPRYHQYTLGAELRQQAMSVCRRVARAAQARDAHPRVPILEPRVWPVEDLKMSVQLGQELEALASFAPFQRLAEQVVVLGKQRGGGGNGPGPWSEFRPVQGELRREPTSLCAHATRATERQVESGKVHRVNEREGIMNRMKRGVWIGALAVIGWGGAPGLSQAGQCQNNLPPSNPNAVYQDHGNGTVTDTRTGLMWQQCSEGHSWSPGICSGPARFTWSQALARAEVATFAGHADWRVPNIKELSSLVEDCRVAPAINYALFPNTPSSHTAFWSASPLAVHSSFAWGVGFYDGNAYHYHRSDGLLHVLLVRGGQ